MLRSKKQSPDAKKNSMDSSNTKLPNFLTAEREKKKREPQINQFRLNKQGLVDEPDGEFSRNSYVSMKNSSHSVSYDSRSSSPNLRKEDFA